MAMPSALRWLANCWLCGTEKDQALLSLWTLHAPDVPIESDGGRMAHAILEFGFSPGLTSALVSSSFSWEHLTLLLASQLWSQGLILGSMAGDLEQKWMVTMRGHRS